MALTIKAGWATVSLVRGRGKGLWVVNVIKTGDAAIAAIGDNVLVPRYRVLPGGDPTTGVGSGVYAIQLTDIVGIVT